MKPGATMRPRASKVLSAVLRILFGGARSATRPSRRSTSIGASSLAAGSITRPPLISSEPDFVLSCAMLTSYYDILQTSLPRLTHCLRQDRHSHRDSVVYYLDDY